MEKKKLSKFLILISVIFVVALFILTLFGGFIGLSSNLGSWSIWFSGTTVLYGIILCVYSSAKKIQQRVSIIIILTAILTHICAWLVISQKWSFIPPIIGASLILHQFWKE
ncbi:MAG: hypothetical protein AABW52_01770 [Nanoarchaeota archaeon]